MTSFQRAREALGQRLRELRQDSRLTGRQLAESQGWQPSKVSRIESGKQTPSDADVEAWARECGLSGVAGDLISALRNLEGHYIEHRRKFRAGKASPQRSIGDREAGSSVIRKFESVVVPGLLQTADYAREQFLRGGAYGGPPSDLEDAVAARMARQQILYRPDMQVHIVMCEASLHHRYGPIEVMDGQLERLLSSVTMRTARIGIMRFEAALAVKPPLHGFSIYDDREVCVETLTASLTLSEPSEISAYLQLFAGYARASVYGEAARAVIARALSELSAG